jgi:hypothetical protein
MTQNSRLQYGSVSKRGKKNKVWIGRWREEVAVQTTPFAPCGGR